MCKNEETEETEQAYLSFDMTTELLLLSTYITGHLRTMDDQTEANLIGQLSDVISQMKKDEMLPNPNFTE